MFFSRISSLYDSSTPGIATCPRFSMHVVAAEASRGAPEYTPLGMELSLVNSILSAILVLALVFSAMEEGRVFVGRGPIHFLVTPVTCLETRLESTRSECAFFVRQTFLKLIPYSRTGPGLDLYGRAWNVVGAVSIYVHRVQVMLSAIVQVSEDCTYLSR